jgi:hypothetical protein
MFAFLVVVVAGTAVGLLMHGSLRNLFAARLAIMPLVIGAAALQIGAQFVPRSANLAAYALIVLSYALLFMFAAANWHVPGMAFIALGAALNYTVILANRGMPIAGWAAARVGFAGPRAEQLVLRGKHFVDAGGKAHLHWLGDSIPLWRQPSIASVGDLIIWAGLILLIASLVRGPRGRRTKMDARDEYAYVPPDHVSARAGDAVLQEIDLRDHAEHAAGEAAWVGEARDLARD